MSSLSHHGIKGQRWGVRRYQNKDGTRTAAGKKHVSDTMLRKRNLIEAGRASLDQKLSTNGGTYINDVSGLSGKGSGTLSNVNKHTAKLSKGSVLNRFATKDEPLDSHRKYVSFTEKDKATYEQTIKGHGLQAKWDSLDDLMHYSYEATKDIKIANGRRIESYITDDLKAKSDYKTNWTSKSIVKAISHHIDNAYIVEGYFNEKANGDWAKKTPEDRKADYKIVSNAMAENGMYSDTMKYYMTGHGTKTFDKMSSALRKEGYDAIVDMFDARSLNQVEHYNGGLADYPMVVLDPKSSLRLKETRKLKHTSIGGTMYIEGNALILGDSSYLEHHGIRGQRWGVRRFQNADGSLTNAGRKRLGYATKGVTQTVGKAFKAGAKAGGKAVKAVKAHHEKKEAEKLEKKKEKASKTRIGVMANKDLFTDAELKKLNDRFKLEDEMKMATLNKGVEIAKSIGTIAQNVGYVAKAYEDITGTSLSPIKRKAAEEKAKQDAEDRERKIAREDAEEARKAAKEERDIAIHEQTLRKAIAAADTQEFTAQKTKAEADSSVLDAIKKGQDFNGGGDAKTDATGKSWIEKATSGGDNPFDKMIYDRDPDYKAAKDAHDEKAEWDQHVKERDARIAARERGMQPEDESSGKQKPQQPQAKSQPQSQPQQKKSDDDDDDRGGFAKLKEALPFDKGRYVNRKAAEKAKDVKESAEEERTKKQDEKAAKAAIDTIIKDYQHQDDTTRSMNPIKYDREVAASVIKEKAKNTLNKVTHPVDTVAKKISDKAREEKWTKERAKLFEEYQDNREKLGTEFANEAYVRAKKQSLQNLGYRGEALDKKLNETPFSKKKKAKHDAFSIQNGVLFVDSSDGLAHHGVKGQRWGVRRFQNADGTRTALGKKREMYGATVSVRGHKSSESVGVTKKQAKGKAAAEILKNSKDLSEKERKSLQKHVDRAEKETAKLEKYKEKKKQSQEENTEEAKVEQWNMMTTGMISPDRYKQNIDTINKNHKREIDYLNKMDERDMANERAFTRKTVAKGMGFALAATAGLAGITAATTGWMVISGYAAIGGGVVGVISGEMKRNQYRDQRRKEMGIDDPGRGKVKDSVYARHDAFTIQNGTLFINAGEPYLEHHGVKGMKWGKHLMAGKGVDAEGGGGGGFAEDDEKLKEMAKKAGMSVAEYRTKMASKIGGAASKVGSAVYDAAGGSHKKNAEGWRKMAQEESNAARASEKSSHENSARAASQDRKYGSGGDVYRRAADSDKENAKTHHSNAKVRSERAASEQAAYEKSLAGKYDKMKADRARKKSAKEKKRLQTQTSAEAKRISVKDKHLIINGNRSSGTRGLAVGETGEKPKSFKEKAYDALGGKYKTQAAEAHKDMVYYKNKADDISRRANAQSRAANANKKAGNVREYMANKEGARQLESEAKDNRLGQWDNAKKANSAQWKYDHSLAGLYDKATGKHKQVHKKTKVPNLMNQANYYYKETSNSKLFNHGKGKAKTAKEQAKAEVWTAADHQIKAKEHNDMSATQGHNESYYGQLYKNAAEREARLAEGSYRRAAALGKQASRETSTSSRPRARKKKHTSGGSGVVVRRPGRKPVSRTKRVTQSSTGVKKRSRLVRHSDGSSELYTEGTRLVIYPKA